MRILHFLWALDNGGAENLVVDLANAQSRDHEVTLLVANARIDDLVRSRIAPAVRFVCLGRPQSSRNPFWLFRLLFALHSLAPDVIHAHSENLAKIGCFIFLPIILTVHATNIKLAPAATKFSAVCCISEAVLLDVGRRYPSLKIRQVNNGVATSEIITGFRQPGVVLRGVQVSRLVHEIKGQDLLIKALAIVNALPCEPKLMIDFVGDGPSLAHLMDVAEGAGVSEFCHFIGAKSRHDIYRDLWQYDLLVQPSRYEGFGLTVAEGMAAGVPVVVSDVEGPMEIINGGEFGSFFQSGNVDELAAALRKAMTRLGTADSEASRRAARRHVIEKYDLFQTAAHYCQTYQEVIDA